MGSPYRGVKPEDSPFERSGKGTINNQASHSMHINFARQLIISEGLQRSSISDRDNLLQRVLGSARPMPKFVREPLKKDIAFLVEKAVSKEALPVGET